MTDQPGSLLPASIVQLISVPGGKLSVTLSPLAVPAVLLASVTLKPIWEPALTLAASDVLVTETVAQSTVSAAEAVPEPSLLVVKLAVLLYVVPQLWAVVLLTTCAFVLVLPDSVVGL